MILSRLVGSVALGVGLLTVTPASADPEPAPAPVTAPVAAPAPAPAPAPVATPAPAPAPVPTWLAQPTPPRAIGQASAPQSSLRSVLALLAVAALGGGAYYMKRRKRAPVALPESARLRVVEAVRVSPHAQVVLTSVNGRMLLLGVTDRSVHRIAWVGRAQQAPKWTAEEAFRDSEPPAEGTASEPPKRESSSPLRPFQAMINALKNGGAAEEAPAALQIAQSTRDTFERRATPRSSALAALRADGTAPAPIAPLEGQVSGLRKRSPKRTT